MPKLITVFPIGRHNKEAVEVLLDTDTSLQQLKDRVRAAIGAACDTQVMATPTAVQVFNLDFPHSQSEQLLVALVDLTFCAVGFCANRF